MIAPVRYICGQLTDRRNSWPLPSGVRDVIRSLGCARRHRGYRGGTRALTWPSYSTDYKH